MYMKNHPLKKPIMKCAFKRDASHRAACPCGHWLLGQTTPLCAVPLLVVLERAGISLAPIILLFSTNNLVIFSITVMRINCFQLSCYNFLKKELPEDQWQLQSITEIKFGFFKPLIIMPQLFSEIAELRHCL